MQDISNVEPCEQHKGKWILVIGNDEQEFNSESEACKAQRKYRRENGFNPITGENLK